MTRRDLMQTAAGMAASAQLSQAAGPKNIAIASANGLACCQKAVEMIVDQWNPSVRSYRTETFCYGPKSCPTYAAGPKRQVPGRKGMRYIEEDWVDEGATDHRSDDG